MKHAFLGMIRSLKATEIINYDLAILWNHANKICCHALLTGVRYAASLWVKCIHETALVQSSICSGLINGFNWENIQQSQKMSKFFLSRHKVLNASSVRPTTFIAEPKQAVSITKSEQGDKHEAIAAD